MPHIASQCSTFNKQTARNTNASYDLKAIEIEAAYINLLRENLKEINKQLNEPKGGKLKAERNMQNRYSQTVNKSEGIIDLSGYLIFVTKSKCGHIRLYG